MSISGRFFFASLLCVMAGVLVGGALGGVIAFIGSFGCYMSGVLST